MFYRNFLSLNVLQNRFFFLYTYCTVGLSKFLSDVITLRVMKLLCMSNGPLH